MHAHSINRPAATVCGGYNSRVSDRPPRPARAEPREVIELKQLKADQPELSDAVDMQIALIDAQRRIQGRVPLPRLQPSVGWLNEQREAGRPAVRFEDIPLDWSDFRLLLRQTADVLVRFQTIERSDHEQIVALTRDGHALEPLVVNWYLATSRVDRAQDPPRLPPGAPEAIEQALVLAIRPFLARCAEALIQRSEFADWHHGTCPICGWEPDFAVVLVTGERKLVCGRCVAQWTCGSHTCPYCGNDDRSRVTSFATRDGRYRVYACDSCQRYLKALDGRHVSRSLLIAVDSVATLPLDAAAMSKGYS